MNSTRFIKGSPAEQVIKNFAKIVGDDIWDKTIIILTMANTAISGLVDVTGDDYEKAEKAYKLKLSNWKDIIHEELGTNQIPIVPAGTGMKPKILKTDKEYWLSVLWQETFNRLRQEEARASFVKLNILRLREIVNEEELRGKALLEQFIQVPSLSISSKSKAAAAAVGGAILAVCGGVISSPVLGLLGVGALVGGAVKFLRE